jgi:lipoprotein-anchoring transpeptidase ErfK/SrfK
MSRWVRTAACGFAVVFSVLFLADASQARDVNYLAFSPPPGMSLTDGQPQHALQLKGKKYRVNPAFRRQVVSIKTKEEPGTIIVDTGNKYLYLILGKGKALRYGIGVARDGFEWTGTHRISRKREWPDWTPPPEMLKRRPELPRHMEGGPNNPLGARALYLGSTLYRIHGTNEPWTIGGNVSSGCIRMVNDDVVDLYERVKVGAKVIVM